jgi:hypothetical protein
LAASCFIGNPWFWTITVRELIATDGRGYATTRRSDGEFQGRWRIWPRDRRFASVRFTPEADIERLGLTSFDHAVGASEQMTLER